MDSDKKLLSAIERVEKLKIVRIYEHKSVLFLYNFIIGMAQGLGAAVGATLVLTTFIFLLSQFQWVPVIGEFIAQVLSYLSITQNYRQY